MTAKIAAVALALVAAGGLVARAMTLPGASPPALSHRTSDCGHVGLPAKDLGLAATRSLTLCLLNEERTRRGLAPLQDELQLELASQRHSDDMVRRRFFDHENPDGADPQTRMLAAGFPANNAFSGENIAWGEGAESSPVEIVDRWMHSPPHRANILQVGFTEIGVGVAMGAPKRVGGGVPAATYTTDFGGPPQP